MCYKIQINNKIKYKGKTMKKILLAVIFSVFAFSTVYAEGKIAVVNLQQIAIQSKAGIEAGETLKKLEEKSVNQIKKKEEEVKKLADEINKQKSSLSQNALNSKNMELNRKSVELERLQKDLQTEFQQKYAAQLEAISQELDPVVKDYAKEKKFDIIFILQPGMVAYYNDSIDITKEILSRFDIKWSKKGLK